MQTHMCTCTHNKDKENEEIIVGIMKDHFKGLRIYTHFW